MSHLTLLPVRREVRDRILKAVTALVQVSVIVSTVAGGFGRALPAQAAAASIWTTQVTCANPADQDANEYANGDHVYVRGHNWDGNISVYGQIHGNPGGSSADPSELVKDFSGTTDGDGYFCIDAYIVGSDGDLDDGVYTVDVWDNPNHDGGSKNDNYHVNAQVGSLTVNKIVDTGSASADNFSFTMTPDPYGVGTFHTTGGSITFSNLPTGNYTVEETGMPSGYYPVSNDCDVDVVNGQNVSCTVHNARITHNVVLTKNVVGGTATASDWTFTLSNDEATYTGIHSGDTTAVFTGTYAITEQGPAGYTMSGVSGDCYEDGGFFVYTDTEGPAHCTVTNTYNPSPANLTISKTDNHTTANPGEVLTYEVTVTNSGDFGAFGVQVTDTVPNFVTSVSDISDSGTMSTNVITWNNLFIAGHSSKTVTFKGTVSTALPAGTTVLHNVANLDCSPFLPEVTNLEFLPIFDAIQCQYSGTATDDTSVTTAPTIGLTKTASPTTLNPSQNVTYTLNWSVAGNAAASNVVLTDPLPTNVGFVSADNGGTLDATTHVITWNLGTKTAGSNGSVSWIGQVAANATAGTITNTATLDSTETAPVTASANITVTVPQVLGATAPDLTISKSVDISVANPGDTVTYTMTVTNVGTEAATNVVLTDTLPAGFTYTDDGTTSKTWNLGTLAIGTSTTVTASVTIGDDVKAGTYHNTAVVTADDVSPRTDQADVTVKEPQVLGVATTGASALDYLLLALGAALIGVGVSTLARSKRTGASPERA